MITKAIIKKLNSLEDNHFIVYIPLLKKANSPVGSATLPATLICIPGVDNSLKVGDVVYVGFENDNYDRPVILGKLYLGLENKEDITTTLTVRTAETTEVNKLPMNTMVGEVNIIDLYTKLTWLMNNNFLPAVTGEDDNNLYAESDIITYNDPTHNIKTVKEALDYLISRL